MIKVTALALFIALCNAAQQGPSRLLLQAGGFGQQQPYNTQNMLYGCLMSGQTYQDCYEMMIQYQQYMQYYQQQQPQPQPQPQPNPVVSPPAPAPLPANPVPLTPANPPATGTGTGSTPGASTGATPGASTGATPGVVSPPATGVSPPPPPVNQVPVAPAPPQVGGVPGLGLGLPGIVPGVPGLLTPPVTDINCGPFPPATQCANRNNGPTGARGLNGLPLGPLEIGANTANNAKLYCDTPGACANSEINWTIRPNPALGGSGIRSINQLLFSEPGSGTNSVVNIKNLQGGNNVELSNLECGTGACNGLILNGWGISLNDVNCAVPSDCMGCLFRNMKTMPDMFCPDPYAADAPNNPNCAIEVTPCFGY